MAERRKLNIPYWLLAIGYWLSDITSSSFICRRPYLAACDKLGLGGLALILRRRR